MAESATEKILRLSGRPVPHGADVAHNAAVLAVMNDKSGTANHSTRDGHVVHSVKNSDAVVVMSHHPEHASHPGRADMAKLTASNDGSPSDGLVAHGILRKSELGRGSSAIQAVRDMVAANEDPDNDDDNDVSGKDTDAKKDLKEVDKKLGGVRAKEGDKK